jgi:geranylgeranyl transferase type-2 subunit beta
VQASYFQHLVETAGGACDYLAVANDIIADFILSLQNEDGGFRGRAAESDLYYTAFALDCLAVTRGDIQEDRVLPFLEHEAGKDHDLIHTVSLVRCMKRLQKTDIVKKYRDKLYRQIEQYHITGAGYSPSLPRESGTPYGCYLAVTALSELDLPLPPGDEIAACLEDTRADEAAYGNEPGMEEGTVTAVAATLVLQLLMKLPVDERVFVWLIQQYDTRGGFLASPRTPVPDLLSTAVALYTLKAAGISLDKIRKSCLEFVEGLWDERGGFCGSWKDDTPDCEYTFYGLLALGCLATA